MDASTQHAGVAPESLPLWYRIPEGFQPVDFAQPPQERFDQIIADLSGLHPSATPAQVAVTALSFEAALARLADDGVVHFSSFLLRTEDDELLSGVCQIAVLPRPPGDPHLYPLSVLESQDPPPEGTHQGLVELPAGVAAVFVAGHEMSVPGAVFGIEGNTLSRVRTVTFQLAFPPHPRSRLRLLRHGGPGTRRGIPRTGDGLRRRRLLHGPSRTAHGGRAANGPADPGRHQGHVRVARAKPCEPGTSH